MAESINDGRNCQKIQVSVRPSVTLSDNYNRLGNKPSINGIELSGNLASTELNLLTGRADDYRELQLGAATNNSFLLALTADGPRKVSLKEVTMSNIATAAKLPSDWEIGSYLFLLKGD